VRPWPGISPNRSLLVAADALKIAGRISGPNFQLEILSLVAGALLAAERK